MAKKPLLPGPNGNATPSAASPWPQQEIPVPDYPGALPNADPRSMSNVGLDAPEPYPGSAPPGEPWKSVSSPAPRRLRRDA